MRPFFVCNEDGFRKNIQIVTQDWAEIFETHGEALYRFAYRLCGSRELSEDAVQECFVSWVKAGRLAKPLRGPLRAYLYGAVRNQVFKALQRARKTSELDVVSIAADQSGDVMKALQQLPEASREALVLVCIEGFSYEEAAEILQVESGSLRVRVHRARKQLREKLGMEVSSHD